MVEGTREVRRALDAGIAVGEIVTCPALAPGDAAGIVADAVAAGAVHTEVADGVFARLSYREGPDGVLAVAATFPTGLDRIQRPVAWRPDPLVLVVAGLEKPGNLGAVLRSAAAAGVDAVVAADPVADVFNPNVVRAAQGALFAVPLAVAGADRDAGLAARPGHPGLRRRPPGVAVAVGPAAGPGRRPGRRARGRRPGRRLVRRRRRHRRHPHARRPQRPRRRLAQRGGGHGGAAVRGRAPARRSAAGAVALEPVAHARLGDEVAGPATGRVRACGGCGPCGPAGSWSPRRTAGPTPPGAAGAGSRARPALRTSSSTSPHSVGVRRTSPPSPRDPLGRRGRP